MKSGKDEDTLAVRLNDEVVEAGVGGPGTALEAARARTKPGRALRCNPVSVRGGIEAQGPLLPGFDRRRISPNPK